MKQALVCTCIGTHGSSPPLKCYARAPLKRWNVALNTRPRVAVLEFSRPHCRHSRPQNSSPSSVLWSSHLCSAFGPRLPVFPSISQPTCSIHYRIAFFCIARHQRASCIFAHCPPIRQAKAFGPRDTYNPKPRRTRPIDRDPSRIDAIAQPTPRDLSRPIILDG